MKRLINLFFLLALFSSLSLGQNGTRMIGFDAKSLGRGGTSIGTFDSPELMMTNPAGISFLNESTLNLNLSAMYPSLHFKNSLNDIDGAKNTFPLPGLAYINKYNSSKFTWGVGMFTAGGMGADFALKHALYRNQDGSYNAQEYHSQLASMQGGLTVAYQANEMFSVGASFHFVYSTLEFSMPYSLDPSVMKGIAQPGMTFGQMFAAPPSSGGFGYTEVTASAKMSELTGLGFNGKIGFACKPNDKLTLGLSYTLPTSLTYKKGKATMDMTTQLMNAFGLAMQGYESHGYTPADAYAKVASDFTAMGIDLSKGVVANYDLNVDLAFPQSLGFGLSYAATDCLQLGMDIEWLGWAKAFDKMTLNLSNGNNANINKMLDNSGTFSLDFPMNWKNSLLVKVGGEYKASKALSLRLGYAYGSNPVPESTVFPVFPAVVEQHVTVGASYKVSTPLTVHAAFETALNKSVTAANPSLIANEYDGSISQLSTIIAHLAFTYTF